jgi:hypothetical protein
MGVLTDPLNRISYYYEDTKTTTKRLTYDVKYGNESTGLEKIKNSSKFNVHFKKSDITNLLQGLNNNQLDQINNINLSYYSSINECDWKLLRDILYNSSLTPDYTIDDEDGNQYICYKYTKLSEYKSGELPSNKFTISTGTTLNVEDSINYAADVLAYNVTINTITASDFNDYVSKNASKIATLQSNNTYYDYIVSYYNNPVLSGIQTIKDFLNNNTQYSDYRNIATENSYDINLNNYMSTVKQDYEYCNSNTETEKFSSYSNEKYFTSSNNIFAYQSSLIDFYNTWNDYCNNVKKEYISKNTTQTYTITILNQCVKITSTNNTTVTAGQFVTFVVSDWNSSKYSGATVYYTDNDDNDENEILTLSDGSFSLTINSNITINRADCTIITNSTKYYSVSIQDNSPAITCSDLTIDLSKVAENTQLEFYIDWSNSDISNYKDITVYIKYDDNTLTANSINNGTSSFKASVTKNIKIYYTKGTPKEITTDSSSSTGSVITYKITNTDGYVTNIYINGEMVTKITESNVTTWKISKGNSITVELNTYSDKELTSATIKATQTNTTLQTISSFNNGNEFTYTPEQDILIEVNYTDSASTISVE